jgi:dihydroxyacetone kinase-like protein
MSQIDSSFLIRFFSLAAQRLELERQHLCALDGEIGDGDHGTSMANGFAAINATLRDSGKADLSPSKIFNLAATVFLSEVGATVGPLYATGFLNAAKVIEGNDLSTADIGIVFLAIAEGIMSRGHAGLGDKTMIDVWLPVAQFALSEPAKNLSQSAYFAAIGTMAASSRDATASIVASRGRATKLKERSLGQIDPGAASATILILAMLESAQ